MNVTPKLGISHQLSAEGKVVHSTIMGTNALGRVSDLLISWVKVEKQANPKFLGDLRLLVQALTDFSCPRDGNALGQVEMGIEGMLIVIATRFECRMTFDLNLIQKDLTQYWLNSDELKYLKKILYPQDRVEVRFHPQLNLIEWRVYRVTESEDIPSHDATFSVMVDESPGLSAGEAELVDAGDLPFQKWMDEIYQNRQTKNRSGSIKVEGGGEQDEMEWARIVVEREQEEIENSIRVADDDGREFTDDSIVVSGEFSTDDQEIAFTGENAIEAAKSRVKSKARQISDDGTLVSGDETTLNEDTLVSAGSLTPEEEVLIERGSASQEKSKLVKGAWSAQDRSTLVTGQELSLIENILVKGDRISKDKDNLVKFEGDGRKKTNRENDSVYLSDNAIHKVGNEFSDSVVKELLADQVNIKEKAKAIIIELKKEQLQMSRESGMLRQKLTKTEELLKRKEIKIQQNLSEIKALKLRPIEIPANKPGPNSDVFRQKAMDMFEKLKAMKDKNTILEKEIEELVQKGKGSQERGPIQDNAVLLVKKELDELTKKQERTLRALESEKQKMKTLSERVIIAEKEAQGTGTLISDLESKVEHQLKVSQQHKKETEQVKQKLVQSDAEKNKIKNELMKAQAQIQTLMKRQAA